MFVRKVSWAITALIVAGLLYQFVVRPMQMQKKLEACLYGAGVTWVTTNEELAAYNAECYRKYGR